MRRRTRIPPKLLAISLLAVSMLACARPEESRPPNIIVILVDTLRADYLGSYGFDGPVSPYMDALAAESIRFEHCISQAPWTKPSVASLFTSLAPETHRVTDHGDRFWQQVSDRLKASALPDEAITLAEVLRAHGYATTGWVGNSWLSSRLGFGQGFNVYETPDKKHVREADEIWGDVWYSLVQHRAETPEKPFFWYLHVMDVHGPYRPLPEDMRAVSESPSLGEDRRLEGMEMVGLPVYLRNNPGPGAPGDPRQLRVWRARYAGGVRTFDRKLGRFLERLEKAGVLDDAVLLLLSDHGEELAEHGGWEHGRTLYAEQTRVPCLIRAPQLSPGTLDEVVSLVDFMPTLLAAAGVASPEGVQGRDLWPVLLGEAAPEPAWAFSGGTKFEPTATSIRSKSHTLVWNRTKGTTELFDTQADPQEQSNLAEADPELRDELLRRLQAHHAQLEEAGMLLEAQGELTEEDIERLRALDYLQ